METFDSTKRSLFEILRDIHKGKIQLPDFQRGWIWDDNREHKGTVPLCCEPNLWIVSEHDTPWESKQL